MHSIKLTSALKHDSLCNSAISNHFLVLNKKDIEPLLIIQIISQDENTVLSYFD